ncbi:hypothetical protein [Pseudomonas amygdali]|uniref:Uncharacterized protein n=2 Tax=Pseudomonas amygdali pv. lachrymans TaxID=53707 RepID=A0ABR5KQZ3_PSEAV|nr:hypothetical protein [Pseudomonas amygdali]AXH59653.1 hypothetical protein PLA107_030990 [Pseudomonas amygdali pv. lachrymans str. M301315]KPC17080.1 Uncharacterized protein AC499_0282 [Pseudomonas amygdali pv. lachrymans]KPC18039.1 Uncharacterized protein AC499_1241 [Pseudomonas amygdali pv. lachrymans]RMT05732.1 hypothetical protein ALP54_03564 [Pseudomonas amygdali pv. lachrymans]
MDTPYPSALPAVLYHVTRDRVRAGQPPQILKNPRFQAGDKYWVEADGLKTPYRIEKCWPTAEQAAAEVKRIAQDELRYAQSKLSELEGRLRKSRRLADDMASPTPTN